MALMLLPVALIALSVVTVIWTVVEVLRHGLVVKVRYPGSAETRHSTKRVVMWWLFGIAVSFLLTVALDSILMFLGTVLVFAVGGLGVAMHIHGGRPLDYMDDGSEAPRDHT